jgi:hypothetical protein
MRLIDADALIEALGLDQYNNGEGMSSDEEMVADAIMTAPTIEPESKISKLELDGLRDKIGRLNEAIIDVEQDRARMVVRYEELSKRYDRIIDGLLGCANQGQEGEE